ncbi:MAG: AarF/UbiB family protein, partial [Halobacteria archaeon]|nr:AarF/UbiB family protein [Halobacteria archaeon]
MVRSYWRFIRAFFQFLPLLLAYARDRHRFLVVGSSREVSSEIRRKRARELKETLIDLGPTYIKLGQILSTRPDVLPQEYIDELMELQDDVPPADYDELEKVIESDLGDPDEVFDYVDEDAISGASLGQVHEGKYRGERVAIKVRRPGVESLVEADLHVLHFTLPILQRFVGEGHAQSMKGLADDFERRIRQEMNYYRESQILNEIRGNFAGDGRVVIPRTHDDVSSERVLTMEYVDGGHLGERRDEMD